MEVSLIRCDYREMRRVEEYWKQNSEVPSAQFSQALSFFPHHPRMNLWQGLRRGDLLKMAGAVVCAELLQTGGRPLLQEPSFLEAQSLQDNSRKTGVGRYETKLREASFMSPTGRQY